MNWIITLLWIVSFNHVVIAQEVYSLYIWSSARGFTFHGANGANDPNFPNTWIPVRNLKRYYIYDTDILYEEDSDEDAHKSKRCHLSVLQRRAIKRMKRQKEPIKSKW